MTFDTIAICITIAFAWVLFAPLFVIEKWLKGRK